MRQPKTDRKYSSPEYRTAIRERLLQIRFNLAEVKPAIRQRIASLGGKARWSGMTADQRKEAMKSVRRGFPESFARAEGNRTGLELGG